MSRLKITLVVGLMLALASGVSWFALRSRQSQAAIPVGAKASFPGAAVSFNPKLLGPATFRPPTPDEQQLSDRLLAASKNMRPQDGNASGPGTSELPKNLLSKAPKLSEAQQRALQKLRWGIAKDLHYRGNGEDATVRMLSSAGLATPTDLSAPSLETPESRALRFVAENRDLFLLKNPNDELVVTAVEPDSNGGKIVRMAQRFNGLEVWPGQLTANLSSGGYLTVITGAYDPTAVSAAFNLAKVYDFYFATFNRNSFDGKGSTILGLVRFPDPTTHGLMANAYWDGQKMCFGNADNYAGAPDVVGHEYSHAVIQSAASLSAGTRTLTLSLDPQYHYLIAPNGGEASMAIAGSALPIITTQPSSQTTVAGSIVTLSVAATGTGPFTYQWRKDGVATMRRHRAPSPSLRRASSMFRCSSRSPPATPSLLDL